ncbi:MAG: ribbon-helix-helix domain-containing protein [Phascolarctobacterium sp.]|nr:ribbon-helix-helix domain-containing protein [Phascolarctobacterium sp.]
MPRMKKDGKAVSFKLKSEICSRLDAYSDTSGIPKTVIVERALDKFLAEAVNSENSCLTLKMDK